MAAHGLVIRSSAWFGAFRNPSRRRPGLTLICRCLSDTLGLEMASRHAIDTQFMAPFLDGRGPARPGPEVPAVPGPPSGRPQSLPTGSAPRGAEDQRPAVPVRLISIDEAAKIMGISRAFFYRTILTPGRISRTVLGRRVLIPLAALDEYIESATIPAVGSGDGSGW